MSEEIIENNNYDYSKFINDLFNSTYAKKEIVENLISSGEINNIPEKDLLNLINIVDEKQLEKLVAKVNSPERLDFLVCELYTDKDVIKQVLRNNLLKEDTQWYLFDEYNNREYRPWFVRSHISEEILIKILEKEVNEPNDEIKAEVLVRAANTSSNPVVMAEVARQAITSNIELKSGFLEDTYYNVTSKILRTIGRNPLISKNLFDELYNHPDLKEDQLREVRFFLLDNLSTCSDFRLQNINDIMKEKYRGSYIDFIMEAKNPDFLDEIGKLMEANYDNLYFDFAETCFEQLALNPNTRFSTCERADEFLKVAKKNAFLGNGLFREGLSKLKIKKNEDVSANAMVFLFRNNINGRKYFDRRHLLAIASSDKLTPELAKEMFDNEEVREIIIYDLAKNPRAENLDLEILNYITEDLEEKKEIHEALASRTNNQDVINILSQSEHRDVRVAASYRNAELNNISFAQYLGTEAEKVKKIEMN